MTDPSAITIKIETKQFEAAKSCDPSYKSYMLLITCILVPLAYEPPKGNGHFLYQYRIRMKN